MNSADGKVTEGQKSSSEFEFIATVNYIVFLQI